MDIEALLGVLAPHTSDLDMAVINNAVQLAENYRPKCLPENKQLEAVALYAAYLLTAQIEAKSVEAGVTSEKEGGLSRSFGNNGLSNTAADYLARYNRLNAACRVGSITVGYNYGC